ncbi:MAG: BamA/TamA family outer membrane protein [bacterium]|nr:BamA/TamA family outer membrane protein [bacterium]
MSVWNPRLVSRTCLLAALLVLLSALAAAQIPNAPVLRLAQDDPTGGLAEWIRQDRSWLRALPAAELVVPAARTTDDDSTTAAVAAAARSLAAGAGPDSTVVLRPVASRLADRWRRRGFLAVSVAVRSNGAAGADTLQIRPGDPWSIGSFDIAGEDFPGRDHLLRTWLPRVGDRYDADELERGVAKVLSGAAEAARPWPRWILREAVLDPAGRTVSLEATLFAGAAAHLGPLSTSLPAGRGAEFALRASGLRPGALFRQSDLAAARDRLLARDLYASVGEPLVHLTTSEDTVGVHLPLVPRPKMNRVQVVLGLSRGEEGGNRLSGQVDLDLPNMAGTGRALSVGWLDDGDTRSRFGFSYLEPLVFGTPLDTDVAMDSEVQRDSYTRFRLDNRWRLPVVALWGVEFGLGWDRATYPTGSLEHTSRTRVRGAVLHKRGDRTRSGWAGSFAVEEAWRTSTLRSDTTGGDAATGSALGEAVTQRIFEVDVAGELRVSNSLGLHGRASFRELDGPSAEEPLADQFHFGGAATLRGYREDEFHGSRAAWGGLELRVGPPRGSRLYTFYDVGYFGFTARETLLDGSTRFALREGWPRGYGLGLLARTAAGDISLAIGFPGTVDFDLAKLHVTLLESF